MSRPGRGNLGADGQGDPSSSQPVNLNALFNAQPDATGEELKRIESILNFVAWISKSDFLHSQQLEPTVGEPLADCPPTVEKQGIKGLSVYTALFDNTDMETYSCKLCSHTVKDVLEDAITHQRVAHFRHYPYQCSGAQIQWYASLCPLYEFVSNYFDSADNASQAKRRRKDTSSIPGTRPGRQRRSVT